MVLLNEEKTEQIVEAIKDGRPAMLGELNDKALALLTPTEVPEDAVEVVKKMRGQIIGNPTAYWLSDSEAAALLTAYAKRVPRAMISEIWAAASDLACGGRAKSINEIALRYGVKVEG